MHDHLSHSPDFEALREAILSGPEKPMSDREFLVKSILAPWLVRSRQLDHFNVTLPATDPFVALLIQKYALPGIERFPFEDPWFRYAYKDLTPDDHWTIVGHVTYQGESVKKIGGVLAGGAQNDTLWETDFLEPMVRLDTNTSGGDMHIFLAPYKFVREGVPRLPYILFNPLATPDDLPQNFMERMKWKLHEENPEKILRQIKILPLEFCIAKFWMNKCDFRK